MLTTRTKSSKDRVDLNSILLLCNATQYELKAAVKSVSDVTRG